ncbi:hypothetical protein QT199_018750 [Xanthomonas phaseoli pv. phaseoli]|uniref:Uncharacterized protein n=2 Tax=Xanthomonas TaxID=338 RepID=A0AB38E4L9_XANCH|nr:hypothetical protein [Xanthomonas phaseoli]MBO9737042.1 hypothetical protein [Xanthomonas phaseoli pv. phaseoli]MBO9745208.1 hypothetical protein [Xanthomonas phaseoli pv. phaseoli]MDM4802044.1 hypothetical protein [Xanthomonas phaseoli pv. phaseoli]MDM4810132.1 hypothetical protein [Xanthomonas phaseoli pv. phaseoli]UZB11840.1 hypothetical protein OM952_19105 [Xanthomonas phaseoli pv. phaseoli]
MQGDATIFAAFALRRSADGKMLRRAAVLAAYVPNARFIDVEAANAAGGLQAVGKSL